MKGCFDAKGQRHVYVQLFERKHHIHDEVWLTGC